MNTSDPQNATHFDPSKKTVSLATGIRLAYVEAGVPGADAVILLHGYTDTARSFFPTIEQLCAQGAPLHIYALDQRGHGDSSMPEIADPGSPEAGFELTQMAADVVAFMDGLGIGSAHIVGHSMGSVVAQELALARPERVRSLLLIGTYVSGSAAGVFEQFLTPVVEGQWKRALRARPGFDYPADAYLATPALADPDVRGWLAASWVADVTAPRAHLAAVLPETAATRLGTWIGALRAQKRFESSARLAALRVPVLVIWATQDNMFPAEPDQRLVREALDLAIDAGSLERYFYKIYGAQAL
ncbi:MAG TPA: alpha/beta hydrolase, partial [Polyangiaceae bacterium]|nr:alpha/beta hydrolase [Polyangiaceae bacterium]